MLSPRARRALGLAFVGLVCGLGFWSPAFLAWDRSGWGDWQQFHHWWEIGVVSIRRWGEWPFWDPHHCGGVSQWGQPQAQNWSPLYLLLAVPFGTVVGHKLFILVHHVIGFTGLYVLARQEEKLRRPGALLAAIVWTSSGFAAWHFAGGHSTFLAFLYYPWLIYCWRRADRDVRWAAAVAAIMAELLLEGGHYPFPYAVVVLGFDSLMRLRRRNAWPLVRTMIVAGVLTGLLGAMRWVPILIAMSRHPRPIEDTDRIRFDEVVEMWTAREHAWRWDGHEWVWAEYGTYVGWSVLALCVIGIALALRRRHLYPVAGALFFLAFSMGYHGPLWPSSLLHALPFFSNLHLPSRWQVVCTMFMALLAGRVVSSLDATLSAWRFHRDFDWIRPLAPWALTLAIALDLYVVGLTITDRWDGEPLGTRAVETPHLVRTHRYLDEFADYPSRNVGTMECYDAVPWHRSRSLWTGEVPQVRIVDAESGETRDGDVLHGYGRTNHRAWADVTLGAPGRVIFNQNYEQQWVSSIGTVVDDDLRLAVDLPAGRHRVEVRFAPDDLPWSVVASALGAFGCLIVVARPWRRARAPRATP
ncbi:hypothetical protein [Sandaracinus amylolyticus]|uniref:YfhO family protein n=1 Tax=Sandaracinus amylolyticus TaxID=927083 RepID=A0A0F6W2P4_9BACT|nr:hypothetical protein [Sandaracinus amylolyticus]AKF05898.1 hypothetical protein DB32_003047 [Sandaracinus amylolyticus]